MPRGNSWRDIRAGDYVWRVGERIAGAEPWLHAPDQFLSDNANLLKAPVAGSGSRVVRIAAHGGGDLVLKEFRSAKVHEFLKVLVRGPRALRSLWSAILLEELALPAVRALGAGYRAGQPWRSFLVTHAISPAIELKEYAGQSAEYRRHALHSLAEIMGQLHAAKLLHGDAHQANFLVHGGVTPVVTMVDVDGIRACRKISLEMAAKDIARLLDYTEPTGGEAMRFAVAYCRARQNAITPATLLSAMEEAYGKRARSRPSVSR